MTNEELLKTKKGFIAALDQSGGSSARTLRNYGINENEYSSEEEMFDLIHKMRSRIIANDVFNSDKIIGVILFKRTMNGMVNGENTVSYLKKKGIVSFLKIDVGLEEKEDGVQMLKEIPNLDEVLDDAKSKGIVGTKMRSVIHDYNEYGIKNVIKQQFNLAKIIIEHGLIPIIEPEVSIDAPQKRQIEHFMEKVIKEELARLSKDEKVIFKFTLPSENNFYDSLLRNPSVLRIVALSGGYKREEACGILKRNRKMIASFSRALLEGLKVDQSDEEFTKTLSNSIDMIYDASVKKD